MIGKQANKSVGAAFCRNSPNKQILIDENNRNKVSSLNIEEIKKLNSLF